MAGKSIVVPCVLVVWWTLAILVIVALKTIFTSSFFTFPYPLFVSAVINVCVFVLLACYVRFLPDVTSDDKSSVLTRTDWAQIIGIGTITGLDMCASNYFLKLLPMATRQMSFALSPIIMLCITIAFRLERFSWPLAGAMLCISVGGIVSNIHLFETHIRTFDSPLTILFVASLTMQPIKWSCTQRVLQSTRTRSLSPLRLLLYTTPATCVVMFCLAFLLEGSVQAPTHSVALVGVLGATAAGLSVMIVAENVLVKCTSALSMSVFGCVHNFLIVVGGVVVFGDNLGAMSVFGYVINQIGVAVYATIRRVESDAAELQRGLLEEISI